MPHLITKLSVMQRIREMAEREKTLKLKEYKCKLGKLVSIPVSATTLIYEKEQIKQKSSEVDIESALSRDPTYDT